MITKFTNVRISSVLSVVPTNEVDFMDEVDNYSFTESQHKKLAKVMGFSKRRVCNEGETLSDYAIYGIQKLLNDRVIEKTDIGALVVVTTTGDYLIPPTSNIIHGALNMDEEISCIDISQGCCGYVIGLLNAFMTVKAMNGKKVLLIAGDMLSYRVSKKDRASRPIVGDAVSISIIEKNDEDDNSVYCAIRNSGKDSLAVYIPAGGIKMPISEETSKEFVDDFGNYRSMNHLVMNGDLVFNFIINKAPTLIQDLLKVANQDINEIDAFICHQSSNFTLKKLADRLGISRDLLPNDIVSIYGNSSSATIPITLCHYFDQLYKEKKCLKLVFAGFGIGLTWGAVLMDVPRLNYCKIIEYPHE